jgi:flavin reductase ActVB
MSIDADRFLATFRDVPTSVAVVTTVDPTGTPHGMTIGSLCALSLSPPLVLFCVAHGTGSHATLCGSARYCLSVLAEDQEDLATRFARTPENRFTGEMSEFHGLPAAPRALAWMLCGRHELVDAGDHTIVIAELHDARVFDRTPMLFWRRRYSTVAMDSRRSGTRTGDIGRRLSERPMGGDQEVEVVSVKVSSLQ